MDDDRITLNVSIPRRWLQYRLRTFLVAVPLMAIVIALLAMPGREPPRGMDGYCPVTLVESDWWAPGQKQYHVDHDGRRYFFWGAGEKRRFIECPERYGPVAAGYDVVIEQDNGSRVRGERAHGVRFEDRHLSVRERAVAAKVSEQP